MLLSNIINKLIQISFILVMFLSFGNRVLADEKSRENCKEFFNVKDLVLPNEKYIKCNYGDGNYAIYSTKTSRLGEYCSYVLHRIEGNAGDQLYRSFFFSSQQDCEYAGQPRARFYTGQSEFEAYELLIIITKFLDGLAANDDKSGYAGVSMYEYFLYDFRDFFADFEHLNYSDDLKALFSVENDNKEGGYVMTLRLKEGLWSVYFRIKNRNIDFYKVVSRI